MVDEEKTEEAESDEIDAESVEFEEVPEEEETLEKEDEYDSNSVLYQEARRLGWAPRAEFEGTAPDTYAFMGPGEYVRHAQMNKRINTMYKKLDDHKDTLRATVKHQRESQDRFLERTRAEMIEDRNTLLIEGDREAADEIDKKIEENITEQQKAKVETESEPKSDEESVEMKAFRSRNDWFDSDIAMTGAAYGIANAVQATGKFEGNNDGFFAEIERQVKEAFPEKFKVADNVVEGGSFRPAQRAKQNGIPKHKFSELDDAGKTVCRQLVNAGVMSEVDYLKDYFGDV